MKRYFSQLAVIFFTTVIVLFSQATHAQTMMRSEGPFHVGFGAEVGLPTGYLSDAYSFSVGGTLRVQYDLDGPLSVILTGGYTSFIGKQAVNGVVFVSASGSSTRYPSYNLVPVKIGFKTFASTSIYFSAEGGAGFETNNNGSTKLILSPGFGYSAARSGFDFGLRYDYLSGQQTSSGQFVARAAYDF